MRPLLSKNRKLEKGNAKRGVLLTILEKGFFRTGGIKEVIKINLF